MDRTTGVVKADFVRHVLVTREATRGAERARARAANITKGLFAFDVFVGKSLVQMNQL